MKTKSSELALKSFIWRWADQLRGFQIEDSSYFFAALIAWAFAPKEKKLPAFSELVSTEFTRRDVQRSLGLCADIAGQQMEEVFLRATKITEQIPISVLEKVVKYLDLFAAQKGYNLSQDELATLEFPASHNIDPLSPSESLSNFLVELLILENKEFSRIDVLFPLALPVAFAARKWSLSARFISELQSLECRVFSFLESSPEGFEIIQASPLDTRSYRSKEGKVTREVTIALPPWLTKTSEDRTWERFMIEPPFPRNGDASYFWHIYKTTLKRGIVLVPNNLLFSSSPDAERFRRELLNECHLEAVIALPNGLFNGTGTSVSLLIFNKTRKIDSILMKKTKENLPSKKREEKDSWLQESLDSCLRSFDREEERWLSRHVPARDIAENDFDFSPERYLSSSKPLEDLFPNCKSVSLGEVADFVRSYSNPIKAGEEPQNICFEVSVDDIDDFGFLVSATKEAVVNLKKNADIEGISLKKGDIVLYHKGAIGRVGFVAAELSNKPAFASQSAVILRIKPNSGLLSSEVLWSFLVSAIGQTELKRIQQGAAIPSISIESLRRVSIPLVPTDQQMKIQKNVSALWQQALEIQGQKTAILKTIGNFWDTGKKI